MTNPIKRWIIKVIAKEIEKNGILIGDKRISYANGRLSFKSEK